MFLPSHQLGGIEKTLLLMLQPPWSRMAQNSKLKTFKPPHRIIMQSP